MPGGRPRKTAGWTRVAIGAACEALHEQHANEIADKKLAEKYRAVAYIRGPREPPQMVAAKLRGFPRVYSVKLRRPKGARGKIIATVAEKFGVPARHVEVCWEMYRRNVLGADG